MSNCLMDILGCTFPRISYKHFLCLVIIKETICIKCQSPFSWKIKKNLSKCCLALTLKAPITTIVSALSSACDFKSHFCKQCGPRSDCSFRNSLIWVHTVCRYAKNSFEKFARIFSRRHKQTTFSDAVFLGALRVKLSGEKQTWANTFLTSTNFGFPVSFFVICK